MNFRRHKRCGQLISIDELTEHTRTCQGVDVSIVEPEEEEDSPSSSELPSSPVTSNDLRRLGALLTGAADAVDRAPIVAEEVAASSRRVLGKLGETLRGEAAETLFNIAARLKDKE